MHCTILAAPAVRAAYHHPASLFSSSLRFIVSALFSSGCIKVNKNGVRGELFQKMRIISLSGGVCLTRQRQSRYNSASSLT
jgi:hypothetical protein